VFDGVAGLTKSSTWVDGDKDEEGNVGRALSAEVGAGSLGGLKKSRTSCRGLRIVELLDQASV
jgi:hypothetical protein